jgi:hypothetical protein
VRFFIYDAYGRRWPDYETLGAFGLLAFLLVVNIIVIWSLS